MRKAVRTGGSFDVLANDDAIREAADSKKTDLIGTDPSHVSTANGSQKPRRRKKKAREKQTGESVATDARPHVPAYDGGQPNGVWHDVATSQASIGEAESESMHTLGGIPWDREVAANLHSRTAERELQNGQSPLASIARMRGESSNSHLETPPVMRNRMEFPNGNGRLPRETARTSMRQMHGISESHGSIPLRGSPGPPGEEDFTTPLRHLSSFDDVRRYRTPGPETEPGPQPQVMATPRMEEWEREHSVREIDQAAVASVDTSIWRYLLREMGGSSSSTDSVNSVWDPKRERVYNTMFHVPWRCELLLDVGFLVCLDSFLDVVTMLPLRLLLMLLRWLTGWRRRRGRLRADELCDLVRCLIMVLGVGVLLQADVSLIYHWIRGQAIIKLYVVYNVLEILDKLCQSFGADVLQVVFSMAERVAACPTTCLPQEALRLLLDVCVALACFLAHALIIMSQAVTLNVAINSHSNALLTLLVSNNFTEVKGNVFKRMAVTNVHKMAYLDTVERFHIGACLLFVLVQNVIKGEASLAAFYKNAAMVVCCEVTVDLLKHAFVAKFNEIKPEAYSEFLQSLCRQTLESQSRTVHRTMSFVPLSSACVVIRGLIPLFFVMLPRGPSWWQVLVGSSLLGGTIAAAALAKAVLGIGLQLHARWYLLRCLRRRQVAHAHEQ